MEIPQICGNRSSKFRILFYVNETRFTCSVKIFSFHTKYIANIYQSLLKYNMSNSMWSPDYMNIIYILIYEYNQIYFSIVEYTCNARNGVTKIAPLSKSE